MRRMIIQNGYDKDMLAVESMSENVDVDSYKVERIGQLVIGTIETTVKGTFETAYFMKLTGAPEAEGDFVLHGTDVDDEAMTIVTIAADADESEIKFKGRLAMAGKYRFNFVYMIKGGK